MAKRPGRPKPPEPNVKVSFNLPESVIDAIDAYIERNQGSQLATVSRSDVLRVAVVEFLKKHK